MLHVLDIPQANNIAQTALGVHLGQRYMQDTPDLPTAAYIDENDDAIPLIKLSAPLDYQNYMQRIHDESQSFHDFSYSPEDDDAKMLNRILQQVRDQATQLLERPINITSLALPREIGTLEHDYLVEAISECEATPAKYGWQFREFLYNAQLAYGLNTCEALGIPEPTEGCDLDEEEPAILFVDYGQGGVLNLYAGIVNEYAVHAGNYRDPWHVEIKVDAQEENIKDLQSIFEDFIQKQVVARDEVQDPRAIIISGDASEAEIENLKQALHLALPEDWKCLVRDQVDPFWVGAVGAARRAKLHVVDSRYDIGEYEEWLQSIPREHDEL
ncbi:hypothetical protein BP00DRAFT_445395 [Aspergillus indologenus CBS 114.80]|uniref:Uncharacterized protein n=1 Tax=Aspergillus indologenus CBS 114.80 TaxID=1450541 RepID=A0A2V5I717_9EURO|nr:hypothetical protein BP00DRAFT_445395 [Aspergillus indologenus CBS 114.80]